jgi:lycopene beta-cyclase
LKQARPDLKLIVLEQGGTLGAQHVWSFFDNDVSPEVKAWLEPLIVHRWPAYTIAFPGRRRRLPIGYNSISSERLHTIISPALEGSVRYGVRAAEVAPGHVVLEGGERLEAPLVLDGRGPSPIPELVLGFQKFVGLEVEVAEPHGVSEPVIMDATVDQHDGYRFVYVLPFGEKRLHIEDTYYSNGPALEAGVLRRRVEAYAAERGWRIVSVEQSEEGVLPIALAGDIDAFWAGAGPTPRIGLRAAMFHPTTGYSLPDAARMADRITAMAGPAPLRGGHNGGPPLDAPPTLTSAAVRAEVEAISKATWRDRAFFRLLNRMMFGAAKPDRRYRVLERFYGLPEPLIRRFYAANMTRGDKARLLVGKPPVPISAALRCLPERGFALKDTA